MRWWTSCLVRLFIICVNDGAKAFGSRQWEVFGKLPIYFVTMRTRRSFLSRPTVREQNRNDVLNISKWYHLTWANRARHPKGLWLVVFVQRRKRPVGWKSSALMHRTSAYWVRPALPEAKWFFFRHCYKNWHSNKCILLCGDIQTDILHSFFCFMTVGSWKNVGVSDDAIRWKRSE